MTAAELPDWLLAQLTAAGRIDTDGTRRTVAHRRHTCGQPILAGLDHDPCGLPVTADPWPVDAMGEALALLAGRRTYDLAGRMRLELNHRCASALARPRRWPVVADHRCGQPLPRDPCPPGSPRRLPDSDTPGF